ncbi:MAG: tetratricopeptide repeat protein [bacterium]|nr:tetratricopeptide repeat protein [bacterium]
MGPRLARVTWPTLLVGLLLLAPWTGPAAGADDAADESGELRDYLSATGLLNRGLHELAAEEYRRFLADHGDHDKADVARYGLAVSLYRLEQHDAAVKELEALLEVSGFTYAAEVRAMLGQCHLAKQRYGPAAEMFQSIWRKHRDHELADDAAALLVEALYLDGKHAEAVAAAARFEKRWTDSPSEERVLVFHGWALVGQGEWSAAAERLSELLDKHPKTPFREQAELLVAQCHEQTGDLTKAVRWYRRVLTRPKGTQVPEALLALAGIAQGQGRSAEAGKLLDRLLEEFADTLLRGRALLLRGRVWFDEGDHARAAQLFKQAGERSRKLADQTEYWQAKCMLRSGDFAGAARRLADALRAHPESRLQAEMRYDRAVALAQTSDDEAAVAALTEFRSEHGDHAMAAEALHLLAAVEHRRGRFDESRAHCRAFLKQSGQHAAAPAVSFLAAENEFLQSRYAEAVKGYDRFIERHPNAAQIDKAQYRRGLALYHLGRLDEAAGPLTQSAKLAASDAAYRPGLLSLGDLHFQREQWAEAERWLSEYLSEGSDVAGADDALLKLGLAQQRQERYPSAIEAYDELLGKHADSSHALQARFERGQALVALGRTDDAVQAFEQVLKDGPDSRFAPFALNHLGAIALGGQDTKAAADLYARVLSSNPESPIEADAMMQRGQALLATREYAPAEKAFTEFIDKYPRHERVALARGQIAVALSRQGRAAEAIEAIEQVERRYGGELDQRTRSGLAYEKAWCLRKLGRDEEAIKAYRALVNDSGNAENVHALLELAELEAGAGRCASAIPLLERVRRAAADGRPAPDDVSAAGTYRLGICTFEAEKYEAAAKLLEEFLDAHPKHELVASASFFCGEALFKAGRHRKAVEHLTRVAESFPKDAVAGPSLLRLGEALAVLQHWDRSEQVFADYLRTFAGTEFWYQAQFGIGWAQENQGRYSEAVASYQKVVDRHQGPTAARAQFQLGECLFAQKKYDEAVRELLKVDILYAYPEWSAAALYEAGRCFEQLGRHVEARAQYQAVAKKHGSTHWAELASSRLAVVAGGALPGRDGG